MSEDKFVTLVTRDPDRNPKWDGDVVFRTPTKEFLRLKGDGTILVEGGDVVLERLLSRQRTGRCPYPSHHATCVCEGAGGDR